MEITPESFEFYTFFVGLKNRELASLRRLLASFPHYDSHVINVVDRSAALKARLEADRDRFYIEPRSYLKNPRRDLDEVEYERLLDEYSARTNRIIEEEERPFHGQAIDEVVNQRASAPYVVVMDSDIEFISDRYLPDMMALCSRHDYDELAAIGMLYQKRPFHLTMSAEVSPSFYFSFMPAQNERVPWKRVSKEARLASKARNAPTRTSFKGRFPRFHTALLVINTKLFREHKMSFRNMYLDVLDVKRGHESTHKLFGDNGASFLFQCALAGRRIVSIDFEEYVIHGARTAVTDEAAETVSWFKLDSRES